MEELHKLEQEILQKHPAWSQDKANWIAKQVLGLTANRK
jgi:hypothetical protein